MLLKAAFLSMTYLDKLLMAVDSDITFSEPGAGGRQVAAQAVGWLICIVVQGFGPTCQVQVHIWGWSTKDLQGWL